MNVVIGATYLMSGIYTNFCRLLCKKCDAGYYVINRCVMKLMITGWCLYSFNFIITQNSQRIPKLNTQNYSLYFPQCIRKNFTSFCRALERCTQKKIGSLFLPHGGCTVELPS